MKLASTPPDGKTSKVSEPRSIVTAATESAPSGHVHDDSARGTIFWEADPVISKSESAWVDEKLSARKQFNVEWVSTSRVPFIRLRGLRNPWNGMKEVKVARDVTKLEPNVGRILAQLFVSVDCFLPY